MRIAVARLVVHYFSPTRRLVHALVVRFRLIALIEARSSLAIFRARPARGTILRAFLRAFQLRRLFHDLADARCRHSHEIFVRVVQLPSNVVQQRMIVRFALLAATCRLSLYVRVTLRLRSTKLFETLRYNVGKHFKPHVVYNSKYLSNRGKLD